MNNLLVVCLYFACSINSIHKYDQQEFIINAQFKRVVYSMPLPVEFYPSLKNFSVLVFSLLLYTICKQQLTILVCKLSITHANIEAYIIQPIETQNIHRQHQGSHTYNNHGAQITIKTYAQFMKHILPSCQKHQRLEL